MAKVIGRISDYADGMFDHVSRMIEGITDEMASDMKNKLVENGAVDTYALYFSLQPETERESGKITSRVLMDAQNPHNGAYYGSFVNYGTGVHNTLGGGRQTPWQWWSDRYQRLITTDGMEARPFIEPVVEDKFGGKGAQSSLAEMTANAINEYMKDNYEKL